MTIQQVLLAGMWIPTYATWNPSDKAAGITLSDGNLAATTTSNGAVRATVGKSAGKWYWEITCTTVPMTALGFMDAAHSLTFYPGMEVTGWGYHQNGQKLNNNTLTDYGAAYAEGDVIGIALDMDAGTVTFYKNGVSQGQAFSGLTGTLYPAVGDINTGRTLTANFGASTFAHSVPSGFIGGIYT